MLIGCIVICAAVMLAWQMDLWKAVARVTQHPMMLRHDLQTEFGRFSSDLIDAKYGPGFHIPKTLPELLGASFLRGKKYRVLRSGSDWWDRPFRYEISCYAQVCELTIRSDGPNRLDDGGLGDDIRTKLVFSASKRN